MTRPLYTPTYQSWMAMRQRCNNPKHKHYPNYGGRGVKVCSRWDSFALFAADMGERPEGTSIDRKDNSKGYSKSNCQWSTRTEQNRNNSQVRLVEYQGQCKCLAEWCQLLGIKYHTAYYRLFIGKWSVQDAFK